MVTNFNDMELYNVKPEGEFNSKFVFKFNYTVSP